MQHDERTEEALHSPASLIHTPLPGHFTDHSPPPPLTLCTPPHSHTTIPLSSHCTHSSSHYTPLALTLHSPHPHPHPPHSSPAPLSLVGPLKLHIVRVLLRQCSPVHGQVTLTAIAREERHGALTRGPGGGRGKGCVHRRQSGLQGGGPGGVSPIVGGGVHGRGRRGKGSSLPCLDCLQGTILQCCMMTATTQVPLQVYVRTCVAVHTDSTHNTQNVGHDMLMAHKHPAHTDGTCLPLPPLAFHMWLLVWEMLSASGSLMSRCAKGKCLSSELSASSTLRNCWLALCNYINVYRRMHRRTCVQTVPHRRSMLTFLHTYNNSHIRTHAYTVYVCMYIHMYIHTYIRTYAYAHCF